MRIISGTAKSLKLKTMKGDNTRPTTDRIKETLFNMISMDIPGCHFLDLFAGSGGIGIEALSRGAKEAYFVEKNRQAASCIAYNLKFTHLDDRGHLCKMDVFAAITQLAGEGRSFDMIFMDPPYGHNLERDVLLALDGTRLVGEQTTINVESDLQTTYDCLSNTEFEVYKTKEYKTNKHTFIRVRR